jgi:hypothetical protein
MKETAVEWLSKQVTSIQWKFADITDRQLIIDHAKEMEKQQIIEAHGDKKKLKSNPDSCVTYKYTFTGKNYYEQYYQKPFLTK